MKLCQEMFGSSRVNGSSCSFRTVFAGEWKYNGYLSRLPQTFYSLTDHSSRKLLCKHIHYISEAIAPR